jgi:hypothetical protein
VFTARYEENLGSPFHVKHHLSWLRQLVAGSLSRRLVIDPGSVHVKFMPGSVEMGQIFLPGF